MTNPCWYDTCEDSSDWTLESPLTCSVDNTNFKQGLSSIKIHTPHVGGLGGKSAVLPMTFCDKYIGMWLRADITTTVSLINLWIMDSADNKVIIQFLNMSPANVPQYRMGIQNVGGTSNFLSVVNYANLSWIWFEFLIDVSLHQITAFANGISLGGWSGWNLTSPIQIAHIGYPDYNATDLWIDFIRVFPTEGEPLDYGITIGTLLCDVIGWEEKQMCKPAIRDVPKDTNGSVVDTGTYLISNRVLEILVRLSDTQLATLNAMFAENAVQTIVVRTEETANYPRWTYTAWFAKSLKKYAYRKDELGEREWIVELVFYCSSYSYAESEP